MAEIVLLGTGALRPLPDRALASAALSCGGRVLLFDCGEGTQARMRAEGVSFVRVDVIALTHYHGDHIFGLPGLLQSMGIDGREAPLTITGPAGIDKELEPVLKLAQALPFELRLAEIGEDGLSLGDVAPGWPCGAYLRAFETQHRTPSQAYRFELKRAGRFEPERARALGVPQMFWKALQRGESVESGGRTILPEDVLGAARKGLAIAYSGDTLPCAGLLRAAGGADLLVCEATYGDDAHEPQAREHGHMTFRQAAALAREAGARELWLTHYSPRITDPAEFAGNARAEFDGVVCGYDGLRKVIEFEKRDDAE